MPRLTEGDKVFRFVLALLAAALIFGGLMTLPDLLQHLPGNFERARTAACQSNLHQLQIAALTYTADNDGYFPRRPAPGGDWMAAQWSALWLPEFHSFKAIGVRPGPLAEYAKNWGLTGCPSDDSRRRQDFKNHPCSSYTWNDGLCGKRPDDVANQPLVWDREPFHRHGRNVARAKAMGSQPAVQWWSEQDFQPPAAPR